MSDNQATYSPNGGAVKAQPAVIYTDNNATSRVAPEVFAEMAPYLESFYGNPSSMHAFGGDVQRAIVQARARVAYLLGAHPDEIVFTSGGTESDNTAIRGVLERVPEKRHIITTRVEHPAVLNLFRYLGKRGYEVTELPVDGKGELDLNYFESQLRDDTALISVMWANNETGVLYPVEEMARLSQARGIVFHTDAVQAVGKVPIYLKNGAISMLSLSSHKLHGPKGVGALYIRKGTSFSPFIIGGHQEHNRRGGTENVPGIVGLGKACELAAGHLKEENTQVKALREHLQEGLASRIPKVLINGGGAPRLPNTLNISFEYVEGEAILMLLNEHNICASSGSACTSGSLEPSHVLRAMGIPFTAAHGSIRFSLSIYNTKEEMDFIIEKMPPIIARLREISPYWQEALETGKAPANAAGNPASCTCSI